MADSYTLYGTEFSLYTGKARAYLRYKGIDFTEVLSTLNVYRKTIIPNTGVRFIPVVETPQGEFIQDTTDIIDTLEARFPQRSVYPDSPAQRLTALLFELLGDEWLLIPAMHYRWNFPERNERFIMGEFGRLVVPWAPGPIRRFAGRRLAANFSGMLPMLGITDKTIPAIEAWYESFLRQLDAHFAAHDYLLGGRASIGDFGLIAPLYAHLYRDPAPGELMRRIAPNVTAWVERMNATEPPVGDWLADDAVPDTLLPILERQFAEQFPVLADTVEQVAEWIDAHPGQRLPRAVGRHRFRIGDAEDERAALSFPQWMLQRPLFYYQGLAGEARAAADALLERAGGVEAMQMRIPRPVERRDNRLVAAEAA